MLKIKLYHFNYKYLSVVKKYLLTILKLSNFNIKNQSLKKVKLNNVTLLKSPHVYKKAQENFGITYYIYSINRIDISITKNFNMIKYIYSILNKSNCFFKFFF